MRLETRGSLQFSGDSRLEALESSLLGPRTQGLCPWVLGAAGDCPGVVSEVVSGVVSGTSEVGDSLLRGGRDGSPRNLLLVHELSARGAGILRPPARDPGHLPAKDQIPSGHY